MKEHRNSKTAKGGKFVVSEFRENAYKVALQDYSIYCNVHSYPDVFHAELYIAIHLLLALKGMVLHKRGVALLVCTIHEFCINTIMLLIKGNSRPNLH